MNWTKPICGEFVCLHGAVKPASPCQTSSKTPKRTGPTREVHVYRLTCAGEHDGVLAERILLRRVNTRDTFAEGIFDSKSLGKNDTLEPEVDEQDDDEFAGFVPV